MSEEEYVSQICGKLLQRRGGSRDGIVAIVLPRARWFRLAKELEQKMMNPREVLGWNDKIPILMRLGFAMAAEVWCDPVEAHE